MSLVVCKFGGSSVEDSAAIQRVAKRVVAQHQAGNQVVVVVSAMGDTTDELVEMANSLAGKVTPTQREMDILLTAGERISMALLAIAIEALGVNAQAFTGPQAGLITDADYGNAKIIRVEPERIQDCIAAENIAIVAGFQGFNVDSFDTTTLGRGGSDTTAVALAAALKADVCEIYTDVDGIFTADPRIVPAAHSIEKITYQEMLELAAHGAKILHLRAVEFARRYEVPLRVRSSFSEQMGTLVCQSNETMDPEFAQCDNLARKENNMEQPIVAGLAAEKDQAKVTVVGVPDVPGAAAQLFEAVASAGVNVDMVVQNVSVEESGKTDISFTVLQSDLDLIRPVLEVLRDELGYQRLSFNSSIGILSIVGAGIRANPGVYAKVFGALRDAGINIEMISATEVRVSVVTTLEDLDRAAQVVHSAFSLDGDENAIVYAGTGR